MERCCCSSALISSLPEALLAQVFSHIKDAKDMQAAVLTCKLWQTVGDGVFWRTARWGQGLAGRLCCADIREREGFKRRCAVVEHLEIEPGLDAHFLAHMLDLVKVVKHLELAVTVACNEGVERMWEVLLRLQSLTHLALNLRTNIVLACSPLQHLSSISALPTLASLEVVFQPPHRLPGRVLPLTGLPQLTRLSLRPLQRCALAGVESLRGTTNLQELELEGCFLELQAADMPHLLPHLRTLTLYSASLRAVTAAGAGEEQPWGGLPLLQHLTAIAAHVRVPSPPPLTPAPPLQAHSTAMPSVQHANLALAAAACSRAQSRLAALMACRSLVDLALGIGPAEAARLLELPPGSWRHLSRLRLVPNCVLSCWARPGALPESWCTGLPSLRLLSLGGQWRLPWQLSKLAALEDLEVEKVVGPLKPLTGLVGLTRLAIKGAHAETLPEGTYLSRLVHLELVAKLLHIPESLATASRLRTLLLCGNSCLRVGGHDLRVLRQLPALAALSLPWASPRSREEMDAQQMQHYWLKRELPGVEVSVPPQELELDVCSSGRGCGESGSDSDSESEAELE